MAFYRFTLLFIFLYFLFSGPLWKSPWWESLLVINIIIIIISFITVFAGVLFVDQPGANHAPRASVTQVNLSVHTLSTFLRIRADPSMQIFWISVIVALSDTFLMFSTIPFFTVPSAPTTTGITTVFICHILCIIIIIIIIINVACSQCMGLYSSVGRAPQRQRRGHHIIMMGSNPVEVPKFSLG